MSLDEMWSASRQRTGCCHFCDAQITAGEDHTICDKCWDLMVPEEEREED
jgi:hypothetical protein